MQITDKTLERLEKLSRIELNAEEKQIALNDLQDLITYIETINEIDTDSVESLSDSDELINVMRNDEVKTSADRDVILSNAPRQAEGCFVVPKTVE
ncbi:MAG: Asp-tRNA(Asn)/Glu-tRNA(Gln) amidotransferase subunit GatC [Clostridia bacterium]|nr:Asp-tRNA(Asn)/Glu-tRNA(Gln) amidotransferase subunit GatC [Clostridia bacterium]